MLKWRGYSTMEFSLFLRVFTMLVFELYILTFAEFHFEAETEVDILTG